MKPLLLYATETDGMGGAEGYLRTLIEHADRGRFRVGLLLPERQTTQPLVAAAQAADTTIHFFEQINRGGLNLRVVRQATKLLEALAPTIIHFNLPNPRRSAELILAAWLAQIPQRIATFQLVGPIRRFGIVGGPARYFSRSLQYRTLHHGIAVSAHNRQLLIDAYGFPADRLHVISNAIDCTAFTPRERDGKFRLAHSIPSEAPLIGVVARLTPTKGQAVLFQALESIWAAIPQMHLVLAGTGEQEAELRRSAATLARPQQIHFLGGLADVCPLLAELDLFVLPSLQEGLPVAAIEAMAMQLAIVATNAGGNRELVAHRQTGLVVPPDDPEALAQAIVALLTDKPRRMKMAALGRERALTLFDQHMMLGKTFALYDGLVV